MMQVSEINEIHQLEPLRNDWRRLLRETPGATFFHSQEWLECYWRHFGAEQRLRLLVVANEGDVIGIVPLVVRHEPTRVGSVRFLTYPLDSWGSFYGPIGRNAGTALHTGFEYLKKTRRDWDVAELRWFRAGDDAQSPQRALEAAGFTAETTVFEQAAMIELSSNWDDYWSGIKSQQRNNVRRGERKLQELGEVQHVRYRPGGIAGGQCDPRWDLYQACETVAKSSWQGQAADGTTLSNDRMQGCLRDLHVVATQQGALDLNVLYVENRPLAFAYNYHHAGYVYMAKVGFDPEFAQTGAGKVLLMRIVRGSFELGDRLIDLGPESMHYKRFWMNGSETTYRCTHFARSTRAQALRMVRKLKDWTSPGVAPSVGTDAPAADLVT